MPESLILTHVTKRYGRGPAVVRDFSHCFLPGSGTALVGPNGSGKTTLIRLITALSFPTSGRITYGQMDIHQSPARWLRYVGFVDDAGTLPQYMTAVEVIEWVCRARGTMDELGDAGIHQLLDAVGMDGRRQNLIGTYSTGMAKKTLIAAALAGKPDVLVLDEPFRGLDESTHDAVEQHLIAFIRDGGLLIMATHVARSVERVCSDVLPLPAGAGIPTSSPDRF